MNLKKIGTILVIFILLIMQLNSVYAADQYKVFRSCVFAIGDCDPQIVDYVDTSIKWGIATFNKLGYSNAGGSSTAFYNVNNKQAVLNWIKYSGNNMQTGENLNIIKEETFRLPLYKLIIEAQKFIRSQLRDFNHLNQDGIFEKVPEYPEFAWLEGITNAVTHRNYAMLGEHIKVFIFDDRMEIRSPGKLPGLVTLENMKNVRYARNTKISETLVDLGLVKELNEGVSRIYEEMNKFFLDEPEYTYEDGDILKLTLKNNIVMRDKRVHETLQKNEKIKNNWDLLSPIEKDILRFINDRGEAGTSDLMNYTGRSKNTVIGMLKKLEDLEIIEWNGTNNFDPKKKYIIKS